MARRILALGCLAVSVACGSAFPTGPSPFRNGSTSAPPAPTIAVPPRSNPSPLILAARPLAIGERIQVVVEGSDPVCFPEWDSSGHCQQFTVVPATNGTLLVSLEIPSPSRGQYDPEGLLVTPNGTYEYTADVWPIRHASMAVTSGLTYQIIVIAYGPFPTNVFLTADLK